MPVLSATVPELESHLYFPVIKQMSHLVINSIDLKDIIKSNIFIETQHSTPKNFRDSKHNAVFQVDKLRAQANISLHPDQLKFERNDHSIWMPYGISHTAIGHQLQLIFIDPKAHIEVYEHCMPTYIQINYTLSLLDRNIAYQIPSRLYRRYPTNMPFNMHMPYTFPIPKTIIALLYTLYKIKRFYKPDNFRQWLDVCTGHNAQFDINRVATKEELVSKKILIDPVCLLEYTEPKPNENLINRTVNQYDINFTVHIQFNRIDMLTIKYPIVVDNRLLPGDLIPHPAIDEQEPLQSADGPYDDAGSIIGPFIYHSRYLNKYIARVKPVMVKFPEYDTWIVPNDSSVIQRKYRPWLSFIFTIDDEKTGLTELPLGGILDYDTNAELSPIVKEILKIQGDESFNDDTIFRLTVFNDDMQMEPSLLHMDENLTVTVPCKDLSTVRRMVLSEVSDLKYLNKKWEDLYNKYQNGLIANQVSPTRKENINIGEDGNDRATLRSTAGEIIARRPNLG